MDSDDAFHDAMAGNSDDGDGFDFATPADAELSDVDMLQDAGFGKDDLEETGAPDSHGQDYMPSPSISSSQLSVSDDSGRIPAASTDDAGSPLDTAAVPTAPIDFEIRLPKLPEERKLQYREIHNDTVQTLLRQYMTGEGEEQYHVEFVDGTEAQVSFWRGPVVAFISPGGRWMIQSPCCC